MEKQSSAENNYNGEIFDHHGGRSNDECQEMVEIVIPQEISPLLASQPKKWERPRIEKVPPQLRQRKEQSEHVYYPVMVSLGPYHHGKQELSRAEEFKYLCLDWCAKGDQKKKGFLYNKIVMNIVEIRECYAEVTIVEKYDDKALALMMLLDACFIINYIHNYLYMEGHNYRDWQNCLGGACRSFIQRDMAVLENQIPFKVLKLLISLRYEKKEEVEGFLEGFFSDLMDIDLNLAKIPEEIEAPPIHLLEAYWRVLTKKHINEPHGLVHHRLASKFQWPRFLREVHNRLVSKFRWPRFSMRKEMNKETYISYAHHSVMDLKGKGIQFKPSSRSLMDITFTSHAFYGQLQLPVLILSDIFPVFFSNIIAYEVSPNTIIAHVMLSYAVFMKSLIQSPEDVKELQEKGILLNNFADLEKAVKLFKEIDTFGLPIQDIFKDVKHKVEEHCNSKAKTWIVDLIHTRFQTPWTTIALFAAVFFLCLTFLQTFFYYPSCKMK